MKFYSFAALVVHTLAMPITVWGQLYSEDFEVDPTASWTVNRATNVDDPQSHAANFFFDYSDVGIPLAPNSDVGDTHGMKLQTNLDFDSDGISGVPTTGVTGMSVSPTGKSFTGDYILKFDAWGNFTGPFPAGSSGTTQMSTFGIGTSGTSPNYPGSADGVWFAATHDGGSASDFRAYSQERSISYQLPHLNPTTDIDGLGNPIDSHATYHAGSRNSSAALYGSTFPSVAAPPDQLTEYPQQTGSTGAGSFGMAWHEVEISKIGNTIDWKVDGVSLITIDSTNFVSQPAGNNILFGSSDINAGASTDPNRFDLLFTLIDNIVVDEVSQGQEGDHNGDGVVDAADHVAWKKDPSQFGGDPAGYDAFYENFGEGSAGGGGSAGVPEPASFVLAALGLMMTCASCRRRA
jgi:hypothetical protein